MPWFAAPTLVIAVRSCSLAIDLLQSGPPKQHKSGYNQRTPIKVLAERREQRRLDGKRKRIGRHQMSGRRDRDR